ncbi:hypothetical protein NFI96_015573, partial [Prochilodus magdalenae]
MGKGVRKMREFVTVLDHKQVNPGDKVTLSCEVNTTTVNVTWKKNGEKLTCLEGKYQINLQGKKCSLEIQNVQEADEGNYTVEVTNRLGTVSCSCTVTVANKNWREIPQNSEEMMETLRRFKISNKVSELRFLLHGPIGAGKSSIINTIKSVFERRLFFNSLVGEAGDIFTLTAEEGTSPILTTFYRGTIESILSSCITACFGSCTASDRKSLQRVVRTAEKIIGHHHGHLHHTLHPQSKQHREHQGFKSDAGNNMKPMKGARQWSDVSELWKIEDETGCSVLDKLQAAFWWLCCGIVTGTDFVQVEAAAFLWFCVIQSTANGAGTNRTTRGGHVSQETPPSYRCTMSALWGLFLNKPEFVTVLDDKQVNPGEKVILTCEVNTTTVNVTWKKNGEKLMRLEGKHKINLQGKKCCLEIQNVQEADEGNYTVEVTNRLGTVSCSCMVTVEFRWLTKTGGKYHKIGAGKSSIINTIKSVFERRPFFNSLVGEAGDSFTQASRFLIVEYQKFTVGSERSGIVPFAFYDLIWFLEGGHTNADPQLIEPSFHAFKGHLPENYEFQPKHPIIKKHTDYIKDPSLDDKIHCLISILPADKISLMKDEVIRKMKDVRLAASKLGIPQVVFMTRVDLVCKMTKADVRMVYQSKKIKDKV